MKDNNWSLVLFFALISFFFAFKSTTVAPSSVSLPKAVIIERDTAGRMVGVVYSRE